MLCIIIFRMTTDDNIVDDTRRASGIRTKEHITRMGEITERRYRRSFSAGCMIRRPFGCSSMPDTILRLLLDLFRLGGNDIAYGMPRVTPLLGRSSLDAGSIVAGMR